MNNGDAYQRRGVSLALALELVRSAQPSQVVKEKIDGRFRFERVRRHALNTPFLPPGSPPVSVVVPMPPQPLPSCTVHIVEDGCALPPLTLSHQAGKTDEPASLIPETYLG